ncbi:SOS-response transcriptional repressor LexA [Paraburkholderia youngii]|uniref:S24 family peptidase n=1 Tax=Paraburkholderia youngii TaxID=2782701 RepID=UPI003D2249AD
MKSIEEIRRDNLQAVIDSRCGGNQTTASKVLGYERSTLVNHWKVGRKKIGDEAARAIEQAFDLPTNWMDAEHNLKETDAPVSAPKRGVIKDSPAPSRHNLNTHGRAKFDQNVVLAPIGVRHIPIISYVQAGMMTEAMDPFALGEGFELVLTDLEVSEGTFGLRIKGDSMLDEFKEGDVVIVDPAVQPLPGDFVVAKNTQEEATFKKYRPRGSNERGDMVFELVPLNDDYPTLHSERDHLRVIGVMVEHRKYRRR